MIRFIIEFLKLPFVLWFVLRPKGVVITVTKRDGTTHRFIDGDMRETMWDMLAEKECVNIRVEPLGDDEWPPNLSPSASSGCTPGPCCRRRQTDGSDNE